MEFVLLPPGRFRMGSEDYGRERPVHTVAIAHPFFISACEVSNARYRRFVQEAAYDGSSDADDDYLKHFGSGGDMSSAPDRPVVWVSWRNAQQFCSWLSSREAITYRLPTEQEWEYSCRAGSTADYYWGEGPDDDCCWYLENSARDTHPTGQKLPNKWGLYDMSGSVWEWCQTHFERYPVRPIPAETAGAGLPYAIRGGSVHTSAAACRSASRMGHSQHATMDCLGFRVVVPVGIEAQVRPELNRAEEESTGSHVSPPSGAGALH